MRAEPKAVQAKHCTLPQPQKTKFAADWPPAPYGYKWDKALGWVPRKSRPPCIHRRANR